MKKYVCDVCGYIYDPAVGDPDRRSNHSILLLFVCGFTQLGKAMFHLVLRTKKPVLLKTKISTTALRYQ